VTNAIKFTRLEETRHISVSLGIALEQPLHDADGNVQFIRTSEASEAHALQADWEKGQIVGYIWHSLNRYLLTMSIRFTSCFRSKTLAVV
jgi:hypothetical protein